MARLLIVDSNLELGALIASAAGSRGHSARLARSGQAALSALTQEHFDVALVDLVLPDMGGTDVLAQLRAWNIPAIALSGVYKGERYAREALDVYGAKFFFEKPFQMGALLTAVDRAARGGGPRPVDEPIVRGVATNALPEHESFETDLLLVDADPLAVGDPQPPSDEHEALLEDHEAQFEELQPIEEEFLRPLLLGPEDEERPPEPTPASEHPLPFGDRGRVWAEDSTRSGMSGPRILASTQTSGSLAQSPVPKLITAFYEARHHGELTLRQGDVTKLIHFEEGQPVYAASNLVHERFGRFCARKGLVPDTELMAVAELAQEAGLRTGEAMVRLGLLTPEQRRTLLEEQIREIIWSTFVWDRGEYALSNKTLARPDVVKLSVFSGDLILQGVSRSETLLSLRRKMGAQRRMFPTSEPPYSLHELTLSDAQAQLVAHADGSKNVADLLTLTDLSEREGLATLLGLEWTGQLHERPGESPQRRISFGF